MQKKNSGAVTQDQLQAFKESLLSDFDSRLKSVVKEYLGDGEAMKQITALVDKAFEEHEFEWDAEEIVAPLLKPLNAAVVTLNEAVEKLEKRVQSLEDGIRKLENKPTVKVAMKKK